MLYVDNCITGSLYQPLFRGRFKLD